MYCTLEWGGGKNNNLKLNNLKLNNLKLNNLKLNNLKLNNLKDDIKTNSITIDLDGYMFAVYLPENNFINYRLKFFFKTEPPYIYGNNLYSQDNIICTDIIINDDINNKIKSLVISDNSYKYTLYNDDIITITNNSDSFNIDYNNNSNKFIYDIDNYKRMTLIFDNLSINYIRIYIRDLAQQKVTGILSVPTNNNYVNSFVKLIYDKLLYNYNGGYYDSGTIRFAEILINEIRCYISNMKVNIDRISSNQVNKNYTITYSYDGINNNELTFVINQNSFYLVYNNIKYYLPIYEVIENNLFEIFPQIITRVTK